MLQKKYVFYNNYLLSFIFRVQITFSLYFFHTKTNFPIIIITEKNPPPNDGGVFKPFKKPKLQTQREGVAVAVFVADVATVNAHETRVAGICIAIIIRQP